LTNEVFSWNPRKDSFDYYGKGHVLDNVAEQRNWTDKELNEEFNRRRDIIKWMVEKGIKNYIEVGEVIAAYYKDPESVMRRVKGSEEKISKRETKTEEEIKEEEVEEIYIDKKDDKSQEDREMTENREASKSTQIEYIKRAIERAYIEVRPEAYIAYAWMNGVIGAVAGVAFIFIYLFLLPEIGIVLPAKLLIIVIPAPILMGAMAYLITMMIPESKANSRKKDIDNKLPYALNFLAAMASAGVTPALAFKSLAEQPIYGEVQREAAWIYRDMSIFKTPSIKFQEFIQGAITTVTSGGDLKKYFFAKSEEYMRENRRNQKEFLETLGVLAESYVTVVVAAPRGGGSSSLLIMYMVTFIMLPLAHLGFAVVISSMSPEV